METITTIATIGIGVLNSFITDILKSGIQNLNKKHPILIAVSRTDQEFKNIENIQDTLGNWLKDANVQKQLKEFCHGKRNITFIELANTLVEDFSFYYGDQSLEQAKEIIKTFFNFLNEEYLKSEEGLVFHSYRNEKIAQKTLSKIEESEQKIIEAVRAEDAKLGESFGTQLSHIRELLEAGAIGKDHLDVRINDGKKILEKGKIRTSSEFYKSLLNEVISLPNTKQRHLFRIYTNLAVCEMELGMEEQAAEHFELAYKAMPTDKKAIVNMAIAMHLKGKPRDGIPYVNKVIQNDSKDLHALSVRIELLCDLCEYQQALDAFLMKEKGEFDPNLMQKAQANYLVGLIFLRMEDFEKAEKYSKRAFELDSKIPDYYIQAGLSMLVPLQKDKKFDWQLTQVDKNKLNEAESLFTHALEIMSSWEFNHKLETTLLNRSVARALQGNFGEAVQDCNDILSRNSKSKAAYRNKAITEYSANNIEEAINSFYKALKLGEDPKDIVPRIVYCYFTYGTEKIKDAIELIKKYIPDNEPNERTLKFHLLLASCYVRIKEFDKPRKIFDRLEKKFGIQIDILLSIHELNTAEEKFDEAEENLLSALRIVTDFKKSIVKLKIADFYYQTQAWDKAIPFLEQIINIENVNDILKKYLTCLYYSSNKTTGYEKCLNICHEIRINQGVIPFITEMEAVIEEEKGNLDIAEKLYSQLGEIESDKYVHRLRLGLIKFRKGEHESALMLLGEVANSTCDDPKALMMIAEVYSFMKRNKDAIKIGYRAYKLSPNDPQINLEYVHIFLLSDNDLAFLNPVISDKDTVITVKIDGQKKEYILVDNNEAKLIQNEIDIKSDYGRSLSERKKGEKFSLNDEVCEILEIKSIYVRAFQEILDNFNRFFPKEKGLKKVKFDKNFKKLFRMLDEKAKFSSQITNIYKERKIPISGLSKLLGIDLLNTWAGLVAIPDLYLRCALGTTYEQQNELELALNRTTVVVDLIAFFTLVHLKCLELLPHMFKTIYVPTSTRDEIHQMIRLRQIGLKRGYMTVGSHNGEYIREEIPAETVEKTIEILNKLLDFVNIKTNVIGFSKIFSSREERLRDMLGVSSFDSIKLAKEKNCIIFSDDKSLRLFASTEHEVDGISIQNFLRASLQEGIITEQEYEEYNLNLLQSKYDFISISAKTLWHCIDKGNFSEKPEVLSLFKRLESRNTSLDSAINVFAEFIKILWIKTRLDQIKLKFLDLSLRALTGSRGFNTIKLLKEKLLTIFKVSPLHLDQILKAIDIWQRSQFIIY